MTMFETFKDRVEALVRVVFPKGTGSRPPNGQDGRLCVMEAVAWVAGEPLSDHPKCASPVLTSLAIRLNDGPWWDSDAERTAVLMPLVVLLAGSRDESRELARVKAIYAWAVRHRMEVALIRADTAAKRLDARWPEHSAKIRAAADVLCADPSAENARRLRGAYAAYAADADAAYAAAAADADAAADAAAYADAAAAAREARYRSLRDELVALLRSLLEDGRRADTDISPDGVELAK